MEFTISPAAEEMRDRVRAFVDERVIPSEPTYLDQRTELARLDRPNELPAVAAELRAEAKAAGLWNLFLPAVSGLSNVDYAVLAEETGRSHVLGPDAMNCQSPDTGNMELLHLFATDEQKERWLTPLLEGTIRSGFSMTEPEVASSDATNISTTIVRDGDHYVVNGRKWWTTGGADPRCELLIVLGRSNPDNPRHQQHSMLLVPRDTPGVTVVRTLPVYGFQEQQGHAEITYEDVRVPADHLLGAEGEGFLLAQGRLGPGRIHHCMRLVGMAERALELMCRRVLHRHTFGSALADSESVRTHIAESRLAIEQVRVLVLRAAWLIDTQGAKAARSEISAIKVLAPRMATQVIDRSIQMHGGAGFTDDFPLASMWSRARTLRIADGPDEVHLRRLASNELRKYTVTG